MTKRHVQQQCNTMVTKAFLRTPGRLLEWLHHVAVP